MMKKIEFTKKAEQQILKIIKNDNKKKYFRITVKGGGCSGFKYQFSFDDKVNSNDFLLNNAIIDNHSLKLIEGSVIDFKQEMIGDSFVINNPNADSSCGCGLSFSIK